MDKIFLNRNTNFKTKKKLKGRNVGTTESITNRRVIEAKKATEINDFRNVWSLDGQVLFLDINFRNKVKAFYD